MWISILRRTIIGVRPDAPAFTLEALPPIASLLRYITSDTPPVERLLLAAYIFYITRVDFADTTADHIALEKALHDEDVFFVWLRGDVYQKSLRNAIDAFYSPAWTQLIVHAYRNPPGTNQLQYALDNLDPIIDLMDTKVQPPGYGPRIENSEHPMFYLLPVLLPEPAHYIQLIGCDVHRNG